MEEVVKLKGQLAKPFEMNDLGCAKKILGMEISRYRKRGQLFLSKRKYLEKVTEKFRFADVKPVKVPLASHSRLSLGLCPGNAEEEDEIRDVPFASVVGCLMCAMVCTRRNLASAVCLVSGFMAKPCKGH